MLALGIFIWFFYEMTIEESSKKLQVITLERVESRIQEMLHQCTRQNRFQVALIPNEELKEESFLKYFIILAKQFANQMEWSDVGLTLSKTGAYATLQRKENRNQFFLRLYLHDDKDLPIIEDHDFKEGKFVFREKRSGANYDPRQRPFYQEVKNQGRSIWTKTYLFLRANQSPVPGISYASPIYNNQGDLVGVWDVDLDILGLTYFLQEVSKEVPGNIMILERPPGEEARIIAHPNDQWNDMIYGEQNGDSKSSDPLLEKILSSIPEEVASTPEPGQAGYQLEHNSNRYLITLRQLTGPDVPHWIIVNYVSRQEIEKPFQKRKRWGILLYCFVCLGGIVALLGAGYLLNRNLNHFQQLVQMIGSDQHPKLAPNQGPAEFRLAAAKLFHFVESFKRQTEELWTLNDQLRLEARKREQTETLLRFNEKKLKQLMEHSGAGILFVRLGTGSQITVEECNPQMMTWLNLKLFEMNVSFSQVVPAKLIVSWIKAIHQAYDEDRIVQLEWIIAPDQTESTVNSFDSRDSDRIQIGVPSNQPMDTKISDLSESPTRITNSSGVVKDSRGDSKLNNNSIANLTQNPTKSVQKRLLLFIPLRLNEAKVNRVLIVAHESSSKMATPHRDMFTAFPGYLTILTMDGKFFDVNDKWLHLISMNRSAVIGKTPKEIGIDYDPSQIDHIRSKLRSHEVVRDEPLQISLPDGQIYKGLLSAYMIQMDGKLMILWFVPSFEFVSV